MFYRRGTTNWSLILQSGRISRFNALQKQLRNRRLNEVPVAEYPVWMEGEMNILLQSRALKASRPQPRLRLSPQAVLHLRDEWQPVAQLCHFWRWRAERFCFLRQFYTLTSLLMRLWRHAVSAAIRRLVQMAAFRPQCSLQRWYFTLNCSPWDHALCHRGD